jgi:Tfp pilus assembly protein PilV
MRGRSDRRGTTLVEALIGLALVSGGLIAALGLATDTARTTRATEERAIARLALLDAMSAFEHEAGGTPGELAERARAAGFASFALHVEPAEDGLARVSMSVALRDGTPVNLARVVRTVGKTEGRREP